MHAAAVAGQVAAEHTHDPVGFQEGEVATQASVHDIVDQGEVAMQAIVQAVGVLLLRRHSGLEQIEHEAVGLLL